MIARLQQVPTKLSDVWIATLESGESVHLRDVSALPTDQPMRDHLLTQQIKSILNVPMLNEGRLFGFVGYDAVRAPRDFTGAEVLLLRSVADGIATLLLRRDTAEAEAAARQTLSRTRDQLRATLDAMPDLVLELDAAGRFTDVHASVPDMLLMPAEQLIGRNLEETLPADVAAVGREVMREVVQNERSEVHRYSLGDKTYTVSAARRAPHQLDREPGFVFVIRDATAEEVQRRELERLSRVVTHMTNLVIMLDVDQRITWVNPAFEARTGYRLDELCGKHPDQVTRCEDTDPVTAARIDAAIAAEKPVRAEILNRTKDGGRYWVDMSVQPMRGADGRVGGFVSVETDITQRKVQEAALARLAEEASRARSQFTAAVEALPDAFVYFDPHDRLLLCNARYRELYPELAHLMVPGAHFEDIIDEGLRLGTYASAVGREEAWRAAALAFHRSPSHATELELSSGRWLRAIEKVTADGGRVGMRVDVTELKHAERRLADIIDGAEVGTWEWHLESGANVINERWAQIIGYTKSELEPVGIEVWRGLIHPEDLARIELLLEAVFKRRQEQFHYEFRMRHKGGHWVWVLSRGRVAHWGADGRPEVMAGVHLDINERRQQEEELLATNAELQRALAERDAAERRFLDIAAVSTDWFWEQDADLRFTYLSESFHNATGCDPCTYLGQTRAESLARMPETRNSADWSIVDQKIARHESFNGFVYAILRPDGRKMWAQISGAPYYDGEGRFAGYRGVGSDITALYGALRRAEEANAAKSVFLANMSHEIRTPLNGVLGLAELLDDAVVEPDHKRMIGTIRESGEALLGILNDILDLSKIEANKLSLEEMAFRPSDLVRRVEALHGLRAQEKGISLTVLTGPGAERLRMGDQHRLLQVLHNLVSNAVKFTEAGEITLTLDCRTDGMILFDLRDTGIGMSQDQANRVFDAFEQADGTVTRRFGGTGLGLSIVRRLVDLMRGQITVESAPGQGTRVQLMLPLPEAESEPAHNDTEPRPTSPATTALAGLRALVADDNATNRLILKAMLGSLGLVCTIVNNGREAIEEWRPEAFDLLLFDISMPEVDGITALATLSEQSTQTATPLPPAVAITANAMAHQVEEYLASGFAAHVAKPFRREDLVEAIQRVVRPA
jgi:PAS domain S-box-containing protein